MLDLNEKQITIKLYIVLYNTYFFHSDLYNNSTFLKSFLKIHFFFYVSRIRIYNENKTEHTRGVKDNLKMKLKLNSHAKIYILILPKELNEFKK